jgi:hypothetical protein
MMGTEVHAEWLEIQYLFLVKEIQDLLRQVVISDEEDQVIWGLYLNKIFSTSSL